MKTNEILRIFDTLPGVTDWQREEFRRKLEAVEMVECGHVPYMEDRCEHEWVHMVTMGGAVIRCNKCWKQKF